MHDEILSKVAAELPRELRSALDAGQFNKLASIVNGLDASSEREIYARIGARMFLRRKEAALVSRGLTHLKALGVE